MFYNCKKKLIKHYNFILKIYQNNIDQTYGKFQIHRQKQQHIK